MPLTTGVRSIEIVVGLIWLVGAASLVLAPPELPGLRGYPALLLLSLTAGIETYLGLGMVRTGGRSLRRASALLMGSLTLYLIYRGLTVGWEIRCHCLSALIESSVAASAVRNVVLLGFLLLADRLGPKSATVHPGHRRGPVHRPDPSDPSRRCRKSR